jgi:opacity protein-like surface antigen
MFKRFAIVVLACAALAIPAAAQNTPQAEIFGGYSYLRLNPGQGISGENIPAGWHASVAGNVNDWFGIVGEISGHYKDIGGVSANAHAFTFGPRFSSRSNEKFTPFAHATFGGTRIGAGLGGGASDTAFTWTLGGGVDVKASDRVAVRITQFDYVATRFDVTGTGATWQHNFRWSAGVVLRVGSK